MPRKKSPDPDKIYSTEPIERQKHFPPRRKIVTRKRLSIPMTHSQKSLTQMHYVIGLPGSGELEGLELEDMENIEFFEKQNLESTGRTKNSFFARNIPLKERQTVEIADTDDEDEECDDNHRAKKRVKLHLHNAETDEGEECEISRRSNPRGKARSGAGKRISNSCGSSRTILTAEEKKRNKSLTQMVVNGRPFVSSNNLKFLEIPDEIPPQSAQRVTRRKKAKVTVDLNLSHHGFVSNEERHNSTDLDELMDPLQKGRQPSSQTSETEGISTVRMMPSPKTPQKDLILEIPSSQSPAATPLSTQSVRFLRSRRSPFQGHSIILDIKKSPPTKTRRIVNFSRQELLVTGNGPEDSRQEQEQVRRPQRSDSAQSRDNASRHRKFAYSDSEDEDREVQINSEHALAGLDVDEGKLQAGSISYTPAIQESPINSNIAVTSSHDDREYSALLNNSLSIIDHQCYPPRGTQSSLDRQASVKDAASRMLETIVVESEQASQATSASAQLLNDLQEYTRLRRNSKIQDKEGMKKSISSLPSFNCDKKTFNVHQKEEPHPSQVSTIGMTQQCSDRDFQTGHSVRPASLNLIQSAEPSSVSHFSSPIRPLAPSTQVPGTPNISRYVQIPSSPMPQPPSSLTMPTSIGTQSNISRGPSSVSQLPDSLSQWEVPAPPESFVLENTNQFNSTRNGIA